MLHLWLSKDRKLNTKKAFALLTETGGKRNTLLVPEQFSHMNQRAFCAYAGDGASLLAEVLDFSHLAQRVFAQEGGIVQTQTDSVGQLLMMALAVEQVRSRLKIYGLGASRPEFLIRLLDMFEEFRSFCVTPAALRNVSKELEGILAQKAEEFALLMESYEAVCENCGQDPKSRLSRLSEALDVSEFGKGECFCFDGFTDFNGIQLEIIGKLLERAESVHIFLCCDALEQGRQPYGAARETAKNLQRLCRTLEVELRVHQLPAEEENRPLHALREHLFTGENLAFTQEQDEVAFLKGKDALDLCRVAAGEILRLVSRGARWRDITVACPDYGSYRPVLTSVFRRAGIPAYFAGDRDILKQGVVHMLLSALEAASGFMEQETVLAYLKSGYSPISREDCDRLENYILLWNITATRFEQPWTMHPEGLNKKITEESDCALAALNSLRRQAIEPLILLKKELKAAANTGEMVLALYEFMRRIDLEASLREKAEACRRKGQLQKTQEYVQLYGILVELLEQMHGVLGSSVRSSEEFFAMFRAALSQSSVGTIPAHLDCVSVGSLMSQRRSDTPYLLVLGANEGSFPAGQGSDSLLTDPERSSLMAVGLGVSPTAAGRLDRELAAMDSVLSAPEKRLYLGAVTGSESYYVRRAERLFPNGKEYSRQEELLSRSERDYLDYLAGRENKDSAPELSAKAEALAQAGNYAPQNLDEEAVGALYGKILHLSSSKVDALAGCRFAYFLNYGLKAEERKSAQIDPATYGTFVHHVLEHTAKQVQAEGGFRKTTLDRVFAIAEEIMEEYTQKELADLWQSARAEYLFRRNFREVLFVVKEFYEELSHSEFEPQWFELHFASKDGDLPEVKIVGEKMTALLEGYVDRSDIWQQGDRLYVRVVDYKTGKKKLEYTNILHGLGLQMLLYLFALEQNGAGLLGQPLTPAGVLYFPARYEAVSVDSRQEQHKSEEKRRKNMTRSGLLLDDYSVLQAMEPCEDAPRYLPYALDKEGARKGYLADREKMKRLAQFVFAKVAALGDELYEGRIDANPYFFDGKTDNGCAYCPYSTVCRDRKQERWLKKVKDPEEFWKQVEEVTDRG